MKMCTFIQTSIIIVIRKDKAPNFNTIFWRSMIVESDRTGNQPIVINMLILNICYYINSIYDLGRDCFAYIALTRNEENL